MSVWWGRGYLSPLLVLSSFLDLVGGTIPEFCHLCSIWWEEESSLFFLQCQYKPQHLNEVKMKLLLGVQESWRVHGHVFPMMLKGRGATQRSCRGAKASDQGTRREEGRGVQDYLSGQDSYNPRQKEAEKK